MIHHYDDYVNIIKKMDEITYWFFSGSDFMPNHNKSPQLDKEILVLDLFDHLYKRLEKCQIHLLIR